MAKRPSRWKRPLLAILSFLLVAGGIAVWGTWWNDWDFQRPPKPLECVSIPKTGETIRFIAFGDYGEGTPFQLQLAQQMAKTYKKTPFSKTLLLGDNFYGDGDVKRLSKPYFEVPYGPLIRQNMQFLAAIGNHDDHDGHREDQLKYFKMPALYYKVSEGPVDFFILNTPKFDKDKEQQAWLERNLATSKASWKVVAGHHPIYSSGRHGRAKRVSRILEPMLEKYHVNLYLAGHDHDYERFQPKNGVHYIVAGGGGAFLTSFRKILPTSVIHLRTHSFVLVEANATDIWLKAINRFGDVVDCDHWQRI